MTVNEAIKFLIEENIKAEKELTEIQRRNGKEINKHKGDKTNGNNSDGL